MTLIKFAPKREMENFQKQMHKYFYDNPAHGSFKNSFSPRINLYEDEKSLFVDVEIPGVNKSDIKITLQDNILTIEGEKKREKKLKEENFFTNERVFGSFKRSFNLPVEVDTEKVKAKFENGMLNISLQKYLEKAKAEKIIEVK